MKKETALSLPLPLTGHIHVIIMWRSQPLLRGIETMILRIVEDAKVYPAFVFVMLSIAPLAPPPLVQTIETLII